MTRFVRPFLIALCLLTFASATIAQSGASAQSNEAKKPVTARDTSSKSKAAKEAEADRILRERRAQAQSLLISLAADAGTYSDQILRARTQARIADALWEVDAERGRTLFRKAWEAAEVADKEGQRRLQEDVERQKSRSAGGFAVTGPPNIRGEVLRLAARRDRALGEELLTKLKIEKQDEATEATDRNRGLLSTPEAISQRLNLARELLDTDIERALQFADPALATITRDGVNFLSFLRDKDPAAADQRYAMMLRGAASNVQSDANTVSLLSSYLFTPHIFVAFSNSGSSTSQTAAGSPPPAVAPELRAAFFQMAAEVLLRPLAPAGQDQTSSGLQGKYLMLKRLLPLFEQYSSREMTDAIRAQIAALAAAVPEDVRQRDDDTVREGIRPPQKSEDREQELQDRIDRAKTSTERDRLYLLLSRVVAERGDLRARDLLDKIEDSELRKKARAYLDVTMTMRFVDKKETDRVLEMLKIGELSHLHRVWALTQASKLLAKTDAEKSLALLDDAATEARRIDVSDPDRPKALMAVANSLFAADHARGWEASLEAVKAANSAEGFTGEDGVLRISLLTANITSVRSSTVQDFDVAGIFTALAKEDYSRSVELARGFEREAPRASAVIAIARSVLSEKQK